MDTLLLVWLLFGILNAGIAFYLDKRMLDRIDFSTFVFAFAGFWLGILGFLIVCVFFFANQNRN